MFPGMADLTCTSGAEITSTTLTLYKSLGGFRALKWSTAPWYPMVVSMLQLPFQSHRWQCAQRPDDRRGDFSAGWLAGGKYLLFLRGKTWGIFEAGGTRLYPIIRSTNWHGLALQVVSGLNSPSHFTERVDLTGV